MFTVKISQLSTSSTQQSQSQSQAFREFKFFEILKATKNFDESLVIGRGGFGTVYRGEVSNGASVVSVAIKRFNTKSMQGATEFWAEVERLSTLRHHNLVSLIGYCYHVKEASILRPWKFGSSYEKEMILVYEYIPNGTLKDHLHGQHTPLSWAQRLKICIDVARGLRYLHTDTGTETAVVHRDVKSSNILLTENWTAKISDFGLSKIGPTDDPSTSVFTLPKGTFGYCDPYSLASGRLTRESDVYSFGVVLFEVLCGKLAVDESRDDEQRSLVTWVQDSVKRRNLEDIIYSDMRNDISPKCLKEFFGIAERCLHKVPKQRPVMAEVVVCLESILTLQERFNNSLWSALWSVQGDPSNSKGNTEFPPDSHTPAPSVKEFTFNDLEKATRGFSQDLLLGEGGFGKVFLGWVEQNTLAPSQEGVGTAVVVKSEIPRLYNHNEWPEEVNFLGQLAHPNIIRLLGCCSRDGLEHLLVYEHMKKNLSHFIHGDEPLTWGTRVHIMIGVARGLTYLYKTKGVLCHFQCNDILLDEDFNAKIGSFGWAKHDPEEEDIHDMIRLHGAFGYLKPDYCMTGRRSMMKNDIYSFGLVLLETITGIHLIGNNSNDCLERLVKETTKIKSNGKKLKKMVDPRLQGSYPLEGAFKCVTLALRCIGNQREDKPSREEILQCLEEIDANS